MGKRAEPGGCCQPGVASEQDKNEEHSQSSSYLPALCQALGMYSHLILTHALGGKPSRPISQMRKLRHRASFSCPESHSHLRRVALGSTGCAVFPALGSLGELLRPG